MTPSRLRLVVQGQVQGVGFRPFVFNLAESEALSGFVHNSPRGVVIEIQGPDARLAAFVDRLRHELPPLARLTALNQESIPPLERESAFTIKQSTAADSHAVLISPDTCTCADCLADMACPTNRRFHYPFTNCTNCGPRYTITRSIPYDRAYTSMGCFPLCKACRAEYENPRDRRFHAQPNACPLCGPRVWLQGEGVEAVSEGLCPSGPPRQGAAAPCTRELKVGTKECLTGKELRGSCLENKGAESPQPWQNYPQGEDALRKLAQALLQGRIAAIKGLGGFHLACDACNDEVVGLLRMRKNRPHKPFAVMAANLAEIERFAHISDKAKALLQSPERPIVICPLHDNSALSSQLSPDTSLVGVMLPYTPLHFVLFEHLQSALHGQTRPAALVMTSGNPGGEPICLGNREAINRLGSMADVFLLHNRDILIRVDDSVVRPTPRGTPLFYRRARGYVPRPTALNTPEASLARAKNDHKPKDAPCILGVGAELKNTLCLTKGSTAFVSQHIGDMSNLETSAFHEEILIHLADLLRVRPKAVVRDLHPNYLASRLADEKAKQDALPLFTLQHHAAHAFAVLAENAFSGKALVLALDGTGLGDDGTLWGGEYLLADSTQGSPGWQRLAHLAPMDLPGGEAAIREPWRIAQALLLRSGPDMPNFTPPWLPEYQSAAALIPAMLERRINTPVSTSCGRLFDAVSALLGLCLATSYEGQAAIRLEDAQGARAWDQEPDRLYACPLRAEKSRPCVLDTHALFAALARDAAKGLDTRTLALRFHHSLARALADAAISLAARHALSHVGLSGGCLNNVTLSTLLARNLEKAGLTVLEHTQLPPGDGCISLGQAYWGSLVL